MNTLLKLIFFILLVSSCHSNKQIVSGQISYLTESINNYTWKDRIAERSISKDSTGDRTENIEKAKAQIEAFLKKHNSDKPAIENSTPFKTYYFKKNRARIIKKNESRDSVYRIFEIKELNSIRRRFKNDDLKIDTTILNYKVNPDWKVNYEITKIPTDTKIIKGFKCIKVLVNESWIPKSGNKYKMSYEFYWTEKINFPPHIVLGWYDNPLNGCMMEGKAWSPNEPRNWTNYSLFEFKKELDESLLSIPEILK